jgi:ABC-2 type transport system permease protein
MNGRKIAAIIKREYVEHIRRKMFWVSTIIFPILWAGFFAVSYFTQTHLLGTKKVAVVDLTGKLFGPFAQDIAGSEDRAKLTVEKRDATAGSLAAVVAGLRREVDEKKIDGYLLLNAASIERGRVEYRAASETGPELHEILSSHLNNALLRQRLEERGLPPDVIAEAQKPVKIEAARLDEKATGGLVTSLVFFIFLYATLIQYGFMNLRGVIEEKSNRIVEIVISSVRPTELMLGKIVGIGLVGLTQYAIWMLLAMNLSLLTALGAPASMIPTIPLSTLAYFVLFFILGYFFYASIYTAIGAPFNTDQEAQQLAMIPTMMIVSVWAFWGLIVNSPNSTIATVLSMIPPLTPMAMFFRVTLAPVPGWQVALATAIMLASIVGVAWFAGKIYRVGILMYGKKPTLPEIFKWMRHSDKAPAVTAEPQAARP